MADFAINSIGVNTDGRSVEVEFDTGVPSGTYDVGTYELPTMSFTVTSKSWTDSGVETTTTRIIKVNTEQRQKYPNQASIDEIDNGATITTQFSLDEFIYLSDTVAINNGGAGLYNNGVDSSLDFVGSVTNNSILVYPKPQGMFLHHDREHEKTSTKTLKLAVSHPYARDGLPVRAINFICTDVSLNTANTFVTTQSVETYTNGSGLSVPHYQADVDISGLTQGELVTIDVEIYPHVGDKYTLSVDGLPEGNANFSPISFLNDRTGGYGEAYAYVNATTGNDGTGVVSATPATAAANPYLTTAAAATGIQTFNNTNYSRNNVSGGTIRLVAGTHTHATFSARAVGEVPLIIEASDSANRATTIYQDAGASTSNSLCDRVKFSNLTLKRNASGNVIFLDSGSSGSNTNILVLEDVTFDDSGFGVSWGAYIYRPGRLWLIGCDGDNVGQALRFSTVRKMCLPIGSGNGSVQATVIYSCVGNKDLDATYSDRVTDTNFDGTDGALIGWNHLGQNTNSTRIIQFDFAIGVRGCAVVGNILEHYGGTTGPAFYFAADGNIVVVEYVTVFNNTVVGSRSNFNYQDTGTATIIKRGFVKNNIFWSYNTKSDIFGTNANLFGNWSSIFKAGYKNNTYIEGSAVGDVGVGSWAGEIAEDGLVIGSIATPLVMDFTNDQSFQGGAAGDGDYSLGALTVAPQYATTDVPFTYDQKGTIAPLDGTSYAGAIQNEILTPTSGFRRSTLIF